MVKRKYIKISFLIFLCIFHLNSIANPWIADYKSYKYSITYSNTDSISRKKILEREKLFIEVQKAMILLGDKKLELEKNKEKMIKKFGYNRYNREIDGINKKIDLLNKEFQFLSSFSDQYSACYDTEYGISDKESMGMKLHYNEDRFMVKENDFFLRKSRVANDLDVYYKYVLYKNDKYIFTIKPNFHYSCYNKNNNWYRFDISANIGYQKQKKYFLQITSFGLDIRKHIKKGAYFGYAFHAMEGMKFNNGLSINNYTEYERIKIDNWIYISTIYNQLSISKEISSNKFNKNIFTASIGYFWKDSLSDPMYRISGPVFSLWFEL